MEEVLNKKISKTDFIKTCVGLFATGVILVSGFSFLKSNSSNKLKKEDSYGLGAYGG